MRIPISIAFAALVPPVLGCGAIRPEAGIFVPDCLASAWALRKPAAQIVTEAARSFDPVRDRITIYWLADDVVPLFRTNSKIVPSLANTEAQRVNPDHDGSAEVVAMALNLPRAKLRGLAYGRDARATMPDELVKVVAAESRAAAELYGIPPTEGPRADSVGSDGDRGLPN